MITKFMMNHSHTFANSSLEGGATMQNKTNLNTHNEIISSEPWHRGSGFTWMLLVLAGAVFFFSGVVAKAGSGFFGDGTGAAIFYGTDGTTAGEGTYRNVSNLDEFDYGDFVVSSGSLILHGGEIKTYKNGGSNVTGGSLSYRIYKNGTSGGSYSGINLPWSADLGGGDQRWKKTDQDVSLLAGLTSSGRYTVEYYFNASSSDGTHWMSNSGGNYQTYFDLGYEINTSGSVNQNVSGGAPALDGDGTFVKKGSGTVNLNNANSGFSGGVYIDAGKVAIAQGATAGSGIIHVGLDGTSSTATISIADADGGTTASNQINIRAGGGTRTIHGENTSGSNTFSGAINLDSAVRLSSASGGTLVLSGTLNDGLGSGTYGATISAGKVEFSGNSSNTGLSGYTVNNGAELRLNKSSGDAIQSTLTVDSGGTATLVAANQLGSGAVVNNNGGTLAAGNNNDSFATLNSSGSVTGTGTLTASTYNLSGGTVSANLGAGTLNVTGDTTLDGQSSATSVAVSGSGTDLNLGSGNNRLSTTADVTVAANSKLNITSNQTLASVKETGTGNGGEIGIGSGATLTVNGANKGTLFQNTISGQGGLTVSGSGTTRLELYGTQSYTGKTTVTGGTLATQSALASTDLEASGGTLESIGADKFADSATITVNGGNLVTGGNDTIRRLNATSGTVNLTGDTLTVTGTGANASAIGSSVAATGGTISVQGALAFQATSGTTALSIASGGTLSGSGTTTGALSVGGKLAPGNSTGVLNVGATTFLGGGSYAWEIDNFTGTVGTSWDFLNITGNLTISATSGNRFIIDVISLLASNDTAGLASNFNDATNYSFAIATASGTISGYASDAFSINTTGFQNSFTGTWGTSLSNDGKSLNITYTATAIPEPSVASMFVLGLSAILANRRRRA